MPPLRHGPLGAFLDYRGGVIIIVDAKGETDDNALVKRTRGGEFLPRKASARRLKSSSGFTRWPRLIGRRRLTPGRPALMPIRHGLYSRTKSPLPFPFSHRLVPRASAPLRDPSPYSLLLPSSTIIVGIIIGGM